MEPIRCRLCGGRLIAYRGLFVCEKCDIGYRPEDLRDVSLRQPATSARTSSSRTVSGRSAQSAGKTIYFYNSVLAQQGAYCNLYIDNRLFKRGIPPKTPVPINGISGLHLFEVEVDGKKSIISARINVDNHNSIISRKTDNIIGPSCELIGSRRTLAELRARSRQ
ncbi:MAG: hypothetical protein E7Z64_03305 [Thermoplasmata archaeon]|nr:hypothetical protein [Thermoplasmata archaeon]